MKTILQFCLLLVLTIGLTNCGDDKPSEDNPVQIKQVTGFPAIDKLTEQINDNPEDHTLLAKRAQAFREAGGMDEALADLQNAILIDSTQAQYWITMSDIYLDYYKSYQGLKTLERATNSFPENIEVLLAKARIQLILKQYEDALQTLEVVRSKDPRNTEMFFLAGHVMKEQGEVEPAILNFQTTVEEDPDMIDAWLMLGDLWSIKEKKLASTYYDNALRIDSTNIEALLKKAYYLGTTMDDIEGALAINRKITRINPQLTGPYFNSGLLLMDQKRWSAAIDQFDYAIKFDPANGKAYYYKAIALEQNGDLAGARANYLTASSFEPNEAAIKEGFERVEKGLK